MWQIWVILAGIFVIFEMVIPTDFLIFWVGMGSLITAIVSLFTNDITVQIAVFCISSILLIFCTKPFVKKFMKKSANINTNAYSIIGKTGIVVSEIDSISGKGQIKVGTEVWSAKTITQAKIEKGTPVKVDSIDGVKAIVSIKEDTKISK